MARRIILCGPSSDTKTALVASWRKRHRKFKQIPETTLSSVKNSSITQEKVRRCLQEQNRHELRLTEEGCPFIGSGVIDILVCAHQCMDRVVADQLAQTPPTRACLHQYKSLESLVVLICSQVIGDADTLKSQLEFIQELLHKFKIPHVYMDDTDQHNLVCCLEQALKGNFPFKADNFKDYPLHLPFVLTEPSQEHKPVSLRRVEVSPGSVTLSFSPFAQRGETNRMVDRYGKERFVVLDFHRQIPAGEVERILHKGMWVNGEEFQFLGCSSSGLKTRTCYMLRGTLSDVETVLKECGNFSSIPSVSKRLSRIGLLFSAVRPTGVKVPDKDANEVDDIETSAGNFTDGCGSIGLDLAKAIVEGARLADELSISGVEQYIPSVYQIRYQGCKGVVITDPELASELKIRTSMKKFKPGMRPMQEVWLCGYSRPYSYGHLNRQFIMLLSGLGIKDEAFLQLQQEHIKQLRSMTNDPEIAIKMLLWNNQPEIAAKVAVCAPGKFKSDKYLQEVVSRLQSNLISKLEKLRLLVGNSRNVYGVCDPLGVLEYGECFFRPTIHGMPKTLSGRVTVGKNPCYLLGDIRVLTAVDDTRVHGLEHLVDCVVFPVQGKRPHPAEIAGSDLDGDQYFVCWDSRFVPLPCSIRKPYEYPTVEAQPPSTVTRRNMIAYFAKQNGPSAIMGRIDTLFKHWADLKGVGCTECRELGQLFSRSVDAAKTGDKFSIPRHLQPRKSDLKSTVVTTKVWKMMEYEAMKERQELSEEVTASLLPVDVSSRVTEEFIWSLVCDKELNMSAFKLFEFIQRWCNGQVHSTEEACDKLLDFSDHINFGEFTVDQQKAAIDAGIPISVVTNALNKSKFLRPDMLELFFLNNPHHEWRFYFRSLSAQFDWEHLLKAVTHHPESIVVVQLTYNISFVLHFLSEVQLGETELNTGSVIAYFFSQHFGFQHRHVLGPQYNLHVESNIIQLYRGNLQRTFIWFCNEEDGAKVSVDLTRFDRTIFSRKAQHPKVRKDTLWGLEVFVKSYRHEPVYLDSYIPSQPDEVWPEDLNAAADTNEEVEELPSDGEDEAEAVGEATPLHSDVSKTALTLLQGAAHKGNCSHFLEILQLIFKESPTGSAIQVQEALLTLLESLVSKYAHKALTPHIEDCLQIIVTSIPHHFPMPSSIAVLQLIKCISSLHCYSLAEQLITPLTTNLQVTQFVEYLDTVSHWENWYFLTPVAATNIAAYLYALYNSSLSASTLALSPACVGEPRDEAISSPSQATQMPDSYHEASTADHTSEQDAGQTTEEKLQEMASRQDVQSAVDDLQIKRYCLYFAHLLLQQFLAETENIQKQVESRHSDGDNSLTMLKAYDFDDPHHTSQEDHDTPSEQDNIKHVWRVGFHRPKAVSSKKFTQGAYVSVHLMTRSQPSKTKSYPVALGCLVEVSSPPTNIIVDVSPPVPHCLKRSVHLGMGHWELRLVGNIITFKRAMHALHSLLDRKTRRTELLPLLVHPDAFPPKSSTTAEDKTHSRSSASLPMVQPFSATISRDSAMRTDNDPFNASQEQAIAAALTQRLTLIHGPPGTGKTHVACEIVCRQLALKEECSVLVTAETNMAVDNLTRQLLQRQLRVVRIGGLGHIAPDVRHASLERQVQMKQNEQDKKRVSRFLDSKLAKEVIGAAQVVATTCAGVGESVLKGSSFPFVIIDEATQVTEPVSLVPIVHHCQQLVLIGDPEQLAPTVPFPSSAQEASDSHGPSAQSMTITLFHRLQNILPSFFLEEQHRMHPELAKFPSQAFYNGKLKSALSTANRPPLNIPWLGVQRPLLFIDVPGGNHEKRIGTSFENSVEADIVVHVVRDLLCCEISPLEVVVLTPYVGQVKCIRNKLSVVASKVEVCTVDSFQGREKEVVVFSTVCNNPDRIGFVGNRNRMNVLLTRMKRGLVGVGCKETLLTNELWGGWLQQTEVLSEREFKESFILKGSNQGSAGSMGSQSRRYSGSSDSYSRSTRNTSQGKASVPRHQDRRNPSRTGHHFERPPPRSEEMDERRRFPKSFSSRPAGRSRTSYSRERGYRERGEDTQGSRQPHPQQQRRRGGEQWRKGPYRSPVRHTTAGGNDTGSSQTPPVQRLEEEGTPQVQQRTPPVQRLEEEGLPLGRHVQRRRRTCSQPSKEQSQSPHE